MNLIINARDAMPDGGTITIAAREPARRPDDAYDLPPGDYVVLTVADEGCGIPPEMLEQVIEPSSPPRRSARAPGSASAWSTASPSNRAARYTSTAGSARARASSCWLPRAPADLDKVPDEKASRSLPVTQAAQGVRVLLADDHSGVRATTAELLHDLGHQVIEASTGGEVLDILEKDPDAFDLLITDYAMPALSGVEVVRRARELSPGLPGIIITGYADTNSISNRPEDVCVIAKPFTPDQLSRAIQAAVQIR